MGRSLSTARLVSSGRGHYPLGCTLEWTVQYRSDVAQPT
jgi:hypothetical protein